MAPLSCLSIVLLLLMINSRGYHAAPVNVAPTDGLLPNGNFEEVPDPSNMNDKKVIIGKYSLPKWVKKGLVRYVSGGPQPGKFFFKVPPGVHAVRLGQDANVAQYLRVKRGTYYIVTFSATKTCTADKFIKVGTFYQIEADYILRTLYESEKPDTYAWTFQSPYSTSIKLSFYSPPARQKHPTCGPLLQAVALKEIQPLPEPLDNLVKNGDFEIGPHVIKNFSSGVLLPPDSFSVVSPLPGWTIKSRNPVNSVKYIDSKHFMVPNGIYAVELVGGKESTLSQVITTIPNQFYNLTFTTGDAKNGCNGPLLVEASAGNQTVKVQLESQGNGNITYASLRFQAVTDATTISFLSGMVQNSAFDFTTLCGPVLDDVKVVPAP